MKIKFPIKTPKIRRNYLFKEDFDVAFILNLYQYLENYLQIVIDHLKNTKKIQNRIIIGIKNY